MSLLVEVDLVVAGAFDLARKKVLSSADIRQDGMFALVPTDKLTFEECKDLVLAICSTVSKADMRSWSSSTVRDGAYFGTISYQSTIY